MRRILSRGAHASLACGLILMFSAGVAASETGGETAPDGESEAADGAAAPPPVEPPLIQVDEVSVTAARAERAVLDQPGNITIITREEILESGVNTVPELLRRQVGVFVTNKNGSNPTGIDLELRGFNNGGGNGSRTLVLIDGRRANLPQTGNTDWALMRIDDVERIEIVRGPASAVYGDNAIGGVIEIFTRRSDKGLQFNATGRGGSYGMGQGSLFAGGSVSDFSGSLFIDGYTADGYRERSDFTTGKAKGNLRYSLGESLVIDIEGGYGEDRRKFPGALTQAEIDQWGRRAADPDILVDRYDVQTGFAQGVVEWRGWEGIVLKLQRTWRQWNQQSEVVGSGFSWTQDSTTSTTTVNGQFEVDRPLGPLRNRLVVGGEWLLDLDKRGPIGSQLGANESRNRRSIGSAYVQEELEVFERLHVSGGFRYDKAHYREKDQTLGNHSRETYDQWSPKAAITWRPFDPFSIYFSYNRGLRFPNFDEIYPVYGSRATVLEPERSTSYEIGAKFRNRQVQAGLTFYTMTVDDELLFDPIAFQNQNIDRVRHRGVEVSVDYQPWTWVDVYANFTYDNTEIRRYTANSAVDGKRLPITPEYRGTAGMNFFLPVPWFDGTELGVNANIVGPRFVANDLLNEKSKLPTYGTVDLHGRIGKKILGRYHITLFFQVQNLNGEKYSQFAALDWAGVTGYYPSAARNFDIGLTVAFEQ